MPRGRPLPSSTSGPLRHSAEVRCLMNERRRPPRATASSLRRRGTILSVPSSLSPYATRGEEPARSRSSPTPSTRALAAVAAVPAALPLVGFGAHRSSCRVHDRAPGSGRACIHAHRAAPAGIPTPGVARLPLCAVRRLRRRRLLRRRCGAGDRSQAALQAHASGHLGPQSTTGSSQVCAAPDRPTSSQSRHQRRLAHRDTSLLPDSLD